MLKSPRQSGRFWGNLPIARDARNEKGQKMPQVFINNFSAQLAAPLAPGDSIMSLDRQGLPPVSGGDFILLTLEGPERDYWEIVKVTAHGGGAASCTIERAQEGTTEREWAEGSPVEARLTAGAMAPRGFLFAAAAT
jgi:hypothetical protein